MTLSLLQTSVVVLADSHNPTILHPHFLQSQGIVPKELELAEAPVCTPPLAIVKFKNGLVLTADLAKLQVQDNSPTAQVSSSLVPECAGMYLRALPHVRYRAIGLNFTGAVDAQNPERDVIERFLKAGPWLSEDRAPTSMGLRLVYLVDDSALTLQLSIDPGTIGKDEGKTRRAIVIRANFHSDVNDTSTPDSAIHAISRFADCYSQFRELSESFFGKQSE